MTANNSLMERVTDHTQTSFYTIFERHYNNFINEKLSNIKCWESGHNI